MSESQAGQSDTAAMTRAELRIFFDGWFCGCGNPDAAAHSLLRLLVLHPMSDHWREFEAWQPDSGVRYLLLYTLDAHGLTEHGGSVGGAWLTAKGAALREGLRRESADGFEAMFGNACIHGIDIDDTDHDCMAAGEPQGWTER